MYFQSDLEGLTTQVCLFFSHNGTVIFQLLNFLPYADVLKFLCLLVIMSFRAGVFVALKPFLAFQNEAVQPVLKL